MTTQLLEKETKEVTKRYSILFEQIYNTYKYYSNIFEEIANFIKSRTPENINEDMFIYLYDDFAKYSNEDIKHINEKKKYSEMGNPEYLARVLSDIGENQQKRIYPKSLLTKLAKENNIIFTFYKSNIISNNYNNEYIIEKVKVLLSSVNPVIRKWLDKYPETLFSINNKLYRPALFLEKRTITELRKNCSDKTFLLPYNELGKTSSLFTNCKEINTYDYINYYILNSMITIKENLYIYKGIGSFVVDLENLAIEETKLDYQNNFIVYDNILELFRKNNENKIKIANLSISIVNYEPEPNEICEDDVRFDFETLFISTCDPLTMDKYMKNSNNFSIINEIKLISEIKSK